MSSTTLSPEQETALRRFRGGYNLFLTGPGGTGKTTLIKHIHDYACEKKWVIGLTALTGCAAHAISISAIGAKCSTIHSWAGIGTGKGDYHEIASKIRANANAYERWLTTRVLVIDEVSMMSARMFTLLDFLGKTLRRNTGFPFGGIQLVVSGDFYQLAPVCTDPYCDASFSAFAFESPMWPRTFPPKNVVQLRTVFRQTDTDFVEALAQIRKGALTRRTVDRMRACVDRPMPDASVFKPTKIFPIIASVNVINRAEMSLLDAQTERSFAIKFTRPRRQSMTEGRIDEELRKLRANVRCEDTIVLRTGAQVMCIQNTDDLFNGYQGIVKDFSPITGNPIVEFGHVSTGDIHTCEVAPHRWTHHEIPDLSVTQLPLILAWAITIHKSQGMTIDAAEIDVGSTVFACGQTYVALSRVRSLEGLYITSFDVSKIRVNKKVHAFYQELDAAATADPEPTDTCPICMMDPDNCHIKPCEHRFCHACITTWCERHRNCPMCRRVVIHVHMDTP